MKASKRTKLAPVFVIFLLFSATEIAAQDKEQQELIKDAKIAKAAFIEEDPEMSKIFANAEGYAIFPNVGKEAYKAGAALGKGVVYENGHLVGEAKLRQVDEGLQLGGQVFDQVLFFKTEAALEKFKKGNIQLSESYSAVIIRGGKAKSITFRNGVAVAIMPKTGAMVEFSVGGQMFEYTSFR